MGFVATSRRFACLAPCLLASILAAQGPSHAAGTAAEPDGFAVETGSYLLAIPGVDEDFVVFADSQLLTRSNGTARFSAVVQRSSALDREFSLELEFSGYLAPGSPGYPPAGGPVLGLAPNAYAPAGPVDPNTFTYYTAVSGSLTGLRSFAGASVQLSGAGPAQFGSGANNKNVLSGFAVDLNLQVLQPPLVGALAPTGPARLRATQLLELPHCATHVDADPTVATGPARVAAVIPGLGNDYVFLPVGSFTEAANGTATLQGLLRRQSDYTDQWQCDLALAGRIDPADPAHPPAGSPVLQLAASAYRSQGGPVDPASWRYYTQVTGTIQGAGQNLGGTVTLVGNGALQVGLGAAQGNLFFGAMGTFTPTIAVQPTARTITIPGDITLQANLAPTCILPPIQVLTGDLQILPNVTELGAVYTGIDLGWVEQVAIATTIVSDPDPRRWWLGNLQVRDHQTIEVFPPPGLNPGLLPVRLLHRSRSSAPLTLDVRAPATPTLRSEVAIATGEDQHWILHRGQLQGPVLSYLVLSASPLPSVLPGQIALQIGNLFQETMVFPGLFHDPTTGLLRITIPAMPPVFLGLRIFQQAALIELANPNLLPLATSDVWYTDY